MSGPQVLEEFKSCFLATFHGMGCENFVRKYSGNDYRNDSDVQNLTVSFGTVDLESDCLVKASTRDVDMFSAVNFALSVINFRKKVFVGIPRMTQDEEMAVVIDLLQTTHSDVAFKLNNSIVERCQQTTRHRDILKNRKTVKKSDQPILRKHSHQTLS